MRKSRFMESQIVAILKEVETGAKIADVCRRPGISQPTYHRWKAKYGGMEVGDLKGLRELGDGNRKLKQLVADQALDIQALKLVAQKEW